MKKLFLAALVLLGLAAPNIGATLPESGHAYKIKHQLSNLWLNTEIDGRGDGMGSHCASLETEENASTVFFIQNPNNSAQWEIRTNTLNGPALGSNSAWNSVINNSTKFYWGLTEQEDGSFVIVRNANSNMNGNVFAPNDGVTAAESPIWTNKNVSESAKWVIDREIAIETGPELTSDPSDPIYYLIKNLRVNGRGPTYATAPGANGQIALYTESELTENPERYDIGALWYFTPCAGRSDVATPYGYTAVNIYNALTGQAIANVKSGDWRTEGDEIVWYICANSIGGYKGYNILSRPNIDQSWNNAAGDGYLVEYYNGNDVGSIFDFDHANAAMTANTLDAIVATRLPLAIAKGNILKNLGVCTDEAVAAWEEAKAAASVDDESNTLAEYQAVVSAYINLQKSVKEVEVRIQHQTHEYEYLGVGDDGQINCIGDADDETVGKGTRVFTLKPTADGAGFKLFNIATNSYLVHPGNNTANVGTTSNEASASVYNFDVWVNGEGVTDGTVGICEINSKPDVAYLVSTDEDQLVKRGAFIGDDASWFITIPSDEIVNENKYTYELSKLPPLKVKAQALEDLGYTAAETESAWATAVEELEGISEFTDEQEITDKAAAVEAAFNLLQSTLKSTVSLTALHKPCNSDYISVNNLGNITCKSNLEGTRALTLSMADNGTGFNIFSEYAGKYLTHPTGNSQNVGLTDNKAQASIYKFDVWVNDDNTADSYMFCHVASGAGTAYLNTNSTLDDIVRWGYTDGSAWYLTLVDENQAATEFLNGAKAAYNGMTNSTGVGQYSVSEAGKQAAVAALAVDETASVDEKRQAGNTLRNLDMTLNMPEVGHVYKFSRVDDDSKVLSCENRGTSRATMVEPTQENLFSTLFYLDEDNRLVALKDGTVLGRFSSTESDTWQTVLPEETAKVGIFTFAEAATKGKYTIATQDNRYLYNANADIDAGSNPNSNGYHWTITDQGLWTPLPGTDAERTTVVLPFAMKRKDHMTFYTATANHGKMILTEFNDEVIPANVPFMLDLAPGVDRDRTNHLVYLERANSEGNVPENNDLCGSIYAKIDTGYVVRNGNHFEPSTSDFIEGFHAHFHSTKIHTITNQTVEDALDALVGKVFALKNTDVTYNRGYLTYSANTDAIWTSNKAGASNDAADAAYSTDPNYHWTLVKDADGRRYLYSIAAQKFAACYTVKGNRNDAGLNCEFVWHFSDYPTAIDFHFLDYDQSTSIEGATFNILGGENTGTNTTRPAGMVVVNGGSYPVGGVSGNSANDGCGFQIKVIADATPGETASVEDALEAMEAEHTAATDYIANHNEDLHPTLPGHYNAEAYALFAEALNGYAEDAEAKYYKLVRARNAAGTDNINKFEDGAAYIIEGNYATIYWLDETRFYTDVEATASATATESSNVWLCTTQGDNVNFTHTFSFKNGMTGEQVSKPANVRSRAAEMVSGAPVSIFNEHSTPTYQDGLGNIMVAEQPVKVLATATAEDAVTTSISEITSTNEADKQIYDLQGRRVSGATRGLYIVNGVKTIIK